MNLVNYNLEAQILEIEAQVKVKNSDISDLESMVNNKIQLYGTIKENRWRNIWKGENNLQWETYLSKVKSWYYL